MAARTLVLFLLMATGVVAQQPPDAGSFEISGVVVDAASGHPLAQARVVIVPARTRGPLRIVITGQDGGFRFQGVNRGKYNLTAGRRGYLTEAFDQHEQYSTAIATGPGLESRGLILRLHSEGKISGAITDAANDPVASAKISLFQDSPLGAPGAIALVNTAIADDEGNYHFGHLQPGKYFVAVEGQPWYARHVFHPKNIDVVKTASTQGSREESTAADADSLDLAYPVTYYPGVTDAASAEAIELTAGERFTADFILQPVRAVPLQVDLGSSASGRHYSFTLSQLGLGGQPSAVSFTSGEISPGNFDLAGVLPGRYLMTVNTFVAKDGEVENLGNSEKEIEVDANGGIHEYSGPQSVAVGGIVTLDQEGKDQVLPPNALAYLRSQKTKQVLYAPISDKGEYKLETGVRPGSYDIGVANTGGALTSSITVTGAKVTGQTLQISGKSAVRANLVLTRGVGRVDGTALLENKPVAGVMVVLAPEDPAHHRAFFRRDQSDSDGTFTLSSVLPGRYTVVAIQDGWKLDYHSPDVLKRFLAQGTPVQVAPHGKYDIKVKVQPANTP